MHPLVRVPLLPLLAAFLLGGCAQGTEISSSEIFILPLLPAGAPDASVDAGESLPAADSVTAAPAVSQPVTPVPEAASDPAAPAAEQVSVPPSEAEAEPVSAGAAAPLDDAGAPSEPAPTAPPAEEAADAAPPPAAPDAGS